MAAKANGKKRGAGSRGAAGKAGAARGGKRSAAAKGRKTQPTEPEEPQNTGRARYHKPDRDYYRDEAERARKDGGGFYKWVDGHNELRIMPPWGPEGRWSKLEMTHFQLPPDRGIARCLCTFLEINPDTVCPICAALDDLAAEFGGQGIEFDRWHANSKYLVNALDVAKNDGIVYIVRLPQKVYNWLNKQMDNPRLDDMMDPYEGLDIDSLKSGSGLQTEYTTTFLPDRLPIADTDEEVQEILDRIRDLNTVIKFPDDAELAKIDSAAQRLEDYFKKRGSRPSQDEYDYRPRGRGGERRDEDIDVAPDGGRRSRGSRSGAGASTDQRSRGSRSDVQTDSRDAGHSPRGTRARRPDGAPPHSSSPPGRGKPECYGGWRDDSRKCGGCAMEYDCQDEQAAQQ